MEFDRGAFVSLLKHPVLLWEAVRARWSMRRRGGVAVSERYMRWRALTAYGDNLTTTSDQDLLEYLVWRRRIRSLRRWERVK